MKVEKEGREWGEEGGKQNLIRASVGITILDDDSESEEFGEEGRKCVCTL